MKKKIVPIIFILIFATFLISGCDNSVGALQKSDFNLMQEKSVANSGNEIGDNNQLIQRDNDLDETVIDECETTIDEAGDYVIEEDLECEWWEDGILINSDNINLICEDGSRIIGEGGDYGHKAIYIEGNNNIIQNCHIEEFLYGIYLYESLNNTLSRNTFSNNEDHGIHLYYSSNNTIFQNTINNNEEEGIYLYYSSNNL